jgi:hypothetical protein
MPKGEKVRAQSKRTADRTHHHQSQKLSVEVRAQSKRTADRTHHHQSQKLSVEYFSIGILLCSKRGESSISKMMYQNPLEH